MTQLARDLRRAPLRASIFWTLGALIISGCVWIAKDAVTHGARGKADEVRWIWFSLSFCIAVAFINALGNRVSSREWLRDGLRAVEALLAFAAMLVVFVGLFGMGAAILYSLLLILLIGGCELLRWSIPLDSDSSEPQGYFLADTPPSSAVVDETSEEISSLQLISGDREARAGEISIGVLEERLGLKPVTENNDAPRSLRNWDQERSWRSRLGVITVANLLMVGALVNQLSSLGITVTGALWMIVSVLTWFGVSGFRRLMLALCIGVMTIAACGISFFTVHAYMSSYSTSNWNPPEIAIFAAAMVLTSSYVRVLWNEPMRA